MATLVGELVVLSGPYKGRRVPISKDLIRLGRERTSDVSLEDEAASRNHAEIRVTEGRLSVVDLDSTNGTYVNDARIAAETILQNGDRVAIGDTVFLLECHSSRVMPSPQVVFSEDRKNAATRMTLKMDETKLLELKDGTTIPDAQRHLTLLYEFMRTVSSILHRRALLEKVLDFLLQGFSADRGVILLLAPDGSPGLKFIRTKEGLKRQEDIQISRTAAREVLENKESFLSINAETDERLRQADSIHTMHVQSIMGVPLQLKDRVLGLIYIDKIEGGDPFSEADLKLCSAMAVQAAVCLENTNLYTELLDAAEFNNSVLRSLSSGLLVVDIYGRIVRINRAALEILEQPEGALLGRKLAEVEELSEMNKLVSETLQSGKSEDRYEVRVQTPRGPVPVGLSTSPQTDHAGSLVGVVANFRDLTRIRRLEEQLRRSQHLAALGQMAAGVAHEIRNPLNSIRGFTQLIQESVHKKESTEKFGEYTQIVLEEVDRMNKIVQDLLDYSRQRELTLMPVHMDRLIADLLKDMQPDFKNAKVKAELIEPETPMPGVLGNGDKLRQVLRNIVLNAVQASREDGSVTLRLRIVEGAVLFREGDQPPEERPRREIAVEVEDRGHGIPPETLPRIFDPFYTDKDVGTGLGLSISQKIVDQHGGRIEVSSVAGEGSTFTVYLPAI
ncbi:MAG: FHA domain-containing protein [Planctomycetes bacterium]|nr:FHA domain-containing protein [Planctomycetota bacterium]